jgi:hypothetical protein
VLPSSPAVCKLKEIIIIGIKPYTNAIGFVAQAKLNPNVKILA